MGNDDLQESARAAYVQRLRRLNSFSRMLANPAILAERINSKLAREGHVDLIVAKRFLSQGQSAGTSWAGLKPATIKQRERQGFASGPILIRSGLLRRAAVEGKTTATATAITKEFKDGAAPRYVGSGRVRKQGMRLKAGGRTGQMFRVRGGRLSDYAGALNSKRSFFDPPTSQELAPLMAARNDLIAESLQRITNGDSLTGFI